MGSEAKLKRSLGTVSVVIYGIGTIVGAGIFVLLGKVIGIAGAGAPWAFLLSAGIAAITGLSYVELVSRIPRSAGEAAYVDAAFGRRGLTLLVGLAVAASGVVSAATISHGFAGYLRELLPLPATPVALVYALALGIISIIGIRTSAWVIGLIAVSSTLGLVVLGIVVVSQAPQWQLPAATWSPNDWQMIGLLSGAFLAFYAFIGFEDLVNLAEEIDHPGPALRVAIPLSLAFAALLYVGLCLAALGAASVNELSASDAPMALLLDRAGLPGHGVVVLMGMVAITNGALAQLIMASRVIYGLAKQQQLPAVLARVHSRSRTPHWASALVIAICLGLIAYGSLLGLAQATSALVLLVFIAVNVALIRLLHKESAAKWKLCLPLLGAVSCALLLSAHWLA